MVQLSFENDYAILKFPKHLVTTNYMQQVLERLQLETWVENNVLSEEPAWELSELLKSEWWENNKFRLLTD